MPGWKFTFSALFVAASCLAPAGADAQSVPTSYNAITDTVARQKPPAPPLGAAGSVIVDPTFNTRILRATDANTVPGDPNQSYRTPSGGFMNSWNSDGTLFAIVYRGSIIPFRFNRSTFSVSRVPGGASGNGGLILNFNPEGAFSFSQPNLYYGMSGLNLTQFDFNTGAYSTLFSATQAVPGAYGSTSSVSVSNDDAKFAFAFGGNGSQNSWANAIVWNRQTGGYTVLNSWNSTVDGRPANLSIGCSIHSAYIDRSGRYVTIGTSGGAHDWLVWDTATGNLGWITAAWSGHDVSGFGIRINQDGYSAPGVYEAVDFVKRSLDLGSLNSTSLLIAPGNLPLPHSGSPGVHSSWNNAQPSVMVPLVSATYRDYINDGEPWRAWDDEVIGVATDGSSTVWRFAHTRSLWTAGDFWATPRPNLSQDGRYVMFTSNWEKSLGSNAEGARQDVFVVELPVAGSTPSSAPDTIPPSVSITAPAAGQNVSGTVTLQATAADNVGVAGVQFKLDGANLGGEDAAGPYSMNWDTTQATAGAHTLTAVARDAAGNVTTSAAVTVNVANNVPAPPPAAGSLPIRVNAGGSAFTDSLGRAWSADNNFSGGSTYANPTPIYATTEDALYDTERYGAVTYRFAVPNGTYTVNLKFVEIWWTRPGQRVFNVVINGQTVLPNFDIVAQAGGPRIPIDKPVTVQVTGGQIAIQFVPVVENPKVSGIEITAGAAPAPADPVRVRAGGPLYWDPFGNIWNADNGYLGGATYQTSHWIGNTNMQGLYQAERYGLGGLTYQFAVPNGQHTVKLHFAEIWWTQPGQRVFNVAINGRTVLTNFDIVAQVGSFNGIVQQFPVMVTNGQITIRLIPVVENPKVSAIEID